MADSAKATDGTETATETTLDQVKKGDGTVFADFLAEMKGAITKIGDIDKKLDDAAKPHYPHGQPPLAAPAIHKGESANTSRPYSLLRYAIGLAKKGAGDRDWDNDCKVEVDLARELQKAYHQSGLANTLGPDLIPLGTDLMPTQETTMVDGVVASGLPVELVHKCRDLLRGSMEGYDPDEVSYLAKRGVLPVRKDLSAHTATTGGVLVGGPTQGELIELLRATEVMSRVGAQEISLPPNGMITFPRSTSSVTISAYVEGQTVTESTPGFGALTLKAKKYAGFVDVPEELIKFATSVSVEGWLRSEFARELALQADRDMINGPGGDAFIQGVINYSGLVTRDATTLATDGDTLEAEDPMLLYAQIADQNAPVDRGFFYAMTNILWGGVTTRKASTSGEFMFNWAANQVGGGMVSSNLNGYQVATSTQLPTNRAKGAGADLTILLGGVGAEWLIARAGVVEVAMTDSDASKFQSGIKTLRGTQYCDAGPRHENSFGIIDTLLNS